MAVAALYARNGWKQAVSTAEFQKLRSDEPEVHNPLHLPIYLVSGWCWAGDVAVLQPRLDALGAELMYGRIVPDRAVRRTVVPPPSP